MTQETIFGPFLAQILLTLLVWVYMFAKRIPFIQSLGVEADEVTPERLSSEAPPAVSNPSDNLKNLFEIPTLFYAMCVYLFITNSVDTLMIALAWLFVLLRYAHSAVHCTFNRVMLRFGLYAASTTALWVMVVVSAYRYLAA